MIFTHLRYVFFFNEANLLNRALYAAVSPVLLCLCPLAPSLIAFKDNAGRASTGGTIRSLATVYLGLGSNVGDRPANLLKAYKGLREVRLDFPSALGLPFSSWLVSLLSTVLYSFV